MPGYVLRLYKRPSFRFLGERFTSRGASRKLGRQPKYYAQVADECLGKDSPADGASPAISPGRAGRPRRNAKAAGVTWLSGEWNRQDPLHTSGQAYTVSTAPAAV